MQDFVQQVVKEIVAGASELDPVLRGMFLNWMGNHASEVQCIDEVLMKIDTRIAWL